MASQGFSEDQNVKSWRTTSDGTSSFEPLAVV